MGQSFSCVAQMWKEEKKKWVKKTSYSVYVNRLNKHILPTFGSGGAPNEPQVQEFVDDLLEEGLSIKTIRGLLLVLRMVMTFGERKGIWPHKPFSVHLPQSGQNVSQPAILTKPQQKILQKHLEQNFSFRNLGLLICLYSGLRVGEICGLKWMDLDLASGEMHIRRTVQRISISDNQTKEYALSVSSPKTSSSTRDIPMAAEIAKYIRPLKKIVNDDYYVITNDAEPLEPRYFRDYFYRMQKSFNIGPVRFHGLRHTFATRCIESGCDYKTLSAILGHSSLSTTMDIYVHPGFDQKKRCIEKMARAVSN